MKQSYKSRCQITVLAVGALKSQQGLNLMTKYQDGHHILYSKGTSLGKKLDKLGMQIRNIADIRALDFPMVPIRLSPTVFEEITAGFNELSALLYKPGTVWNISAEERTLSTTPSFSAWRGIEEICRSWSVFSDNSESFYVGWTGIIREGQLIEEDVNRLISTIESFEPIANWALSLSHPGGSVTFYQLAKQCIMSI